MTDNIKVIEELNVNTTSWHKMKKMCNSCGAEGEITYNPKCKPHVNHFPCLCGAQDFTELTHFSGD